MKTKVLMLLIFLSCAVSACKQAPTILNNDILLATVETRGDYRQLSDAEKNNYLFEKISLRIDNNVKNFDASSYMHSYLYPYVDVDCFACGVINDTVLFNNSSTNLIERGIDEADTIKTSDGFIYSVTDNNTFNIYQHQDNNQPVQLAALPIGDDLNQENDAYHFSHLYLSDFYLLQQNAIIQGNYLNYYYPTSPLSNLSESLIAFEANEKNFLFSVDISQKDAPITNARAAINNASIVTSRRINNTIFYLLDSQPNYDLLNPVYQEIDDYLKSIDNLEEIYKSNTLRPLYVQLLASKFAIAVENLKQEYKQDPNKIHNITYQHNENEYSNIDNCLYNPELNTSNSGLRYNILLAVDANDLNLKNYLCFEKNSYTSNKDFYMSSDAIYLFNRFYVETEKDATQVQQPAMRVSRFVFDNDNGNIAYHGFAEVLGHFPNNGNAHFYMSEYNNHLRLFTNAATDLNNPYNMLHVLKSSENQLSHLAQLPNNDLPKQIGKEFEFVYGARFINEQAYLITGVRRFTQDPLIRFDLSQPATPRISGELDVLSFANYLHPVSDELLLGVGRNQNDVDIRLFNISQDTPELVDSLSIVDSRANLLWDHHGICTQNDNGNGVFKSAFVTTNQTGDYSQQWLQLQTNKTASLASLAIEQFTLPQRHYNARCLYINDSFYSFNGSTLNKLD